MKKLTNKRFLTFVMTFLIAIVFFASTTLSTVSAASKKETLKYNQTDFLNYMAYDAVLLKKIEKTIDKMDKLNPEADPKPYLTNSKKYLKELKTILKKIKEYPTKNKDIQALKKIQVKIVEDTVDLYALSITVFETQDEKNIKKLEEKLKTFESDIEKMALKYGELTEKTMLKYQVKMNKDIDYVAFSGNGPKISSESFTYTVKKGDDLNKIAKTYKVSASDIKKWSKLKSSKLKVGQKLKIQVK